MDLRQYREDAGHHRHCPGVPRAEEWRHYQARLLSELRDTPDATHARTLSDRAWVVMLYRRGLIPKGAAQAILTALGAEDDPNDSGEIWLRRQVGDDDVGSMVNLGRTAQEPMSRIQLREKLADVLGLTLKTLGVLLDVAEDHVETVMPGQTHLSHAQPTTYAAYLLSVHDALAWAFELLELSWRHVNQNTAGYGALAGSGWDVDRAMVTDLLGFDETVELTYDCETGQDHAMTTLYALNSVGTLLSRVAMDYNLWALEEVGWIATPPEWRGVSSLMPQKSIPCSQFERIRLDAADVAGEMMRGLMGIAKEPNQDMLPIYGAWRGALKAMCHTERALGFFQGMLSVLIVDRARMIGAARRGYAATPDLAIVLIRDLGFGSRRAHRVCATFVRMARERGLVACEATGELLDEAARSIREREPGLSTEAVRQALDPVRFLERHNNLGDPNPAESRRMIVARREALTLLRARHEERLSRIGEALADLAREIRAILGEPSDAP